MAKKKENLIKKNVLLKYEYDREGGNILINDFLQLNKIVQELKVTNKNAYNAMLCLIQDKIELQDGCKERGKKKK